MRILHTGDIHLDASFADAALPPGLGARCRQSLRDVLAAMLHRAAAWPADAVLIAGDLFAHDRVTRDTVAFLRGAFESIAPIPVFIAPGDRDPFVPTSPYATEAWPANVHVFQRPAWHSHALCDVPLTVHGFAFDGPEPSNSPIGTLAAPRDGRAHVAVGHGSAREALPDGVRPAHPFAARDAAAPGLAYLALGHYPRVARVPGDFATVMYYAGAPEGHGFADTGPRHCLEVEIDPSCGAEAPAVTVRPVPSARLTYGETALDAGGLSGPEELSAALRALADVPDHPQVLRVRLRGACPPAVQRGLAAAQAAAASAFVHLDLIDETTLDAPFGEIAMEDTSLGAFVRRLGEEIKDAPDAARRAMLERARDLGVAAFRGESLPVRGPRDATP